MGSQEQPSSYHSGNFSSDNATMDWHSTSTARLSRRMPPAMPSSSPPSHCQRRIPTWCIHSFQLDFHRPSITFPWFMLNVLWSQTLKTCRPVQVAPSLLIYGFSKTGAATSVIVTGQLDPAVSNNQIEGSALMEIKYAWPCIGYLAAIDIVLFRSHGVHQTLDSVIHFRPTLPNGVTFIILGQRVSYHFCTCLLSTSLA